MASRIMQIGALIAWLFVLQFGGYCMGMLTEANLEPWYRMLHKSSLTPPDMMFAVVWPILYVLLALVGWRIFLKETQTTTHIKVTYIFQLILNMMWTPLFFGLHWVGAALLLLIVSVLVTFYLITRLYQEKQQVLSYLLMPYGLWIAFATYLNFVTFMH